MERRWELIIEGSVNKKDWLPFHFKYKVGSPKTSLRFLLPHLPRLDWKVWLLGAQLQYDLMQSRRVTEYPRTSYIYSGDIPDWYRNLLKGILLNDRTVLSLLDDQHLPCFTPPIKHYSLKRPNSLPARLTPVKSIPSKNTSARLPNTQSSASNIHRIAFNKQNPSSSTTHANHKLPTSSKNSKNGVRSRDSKINGNSSTPYKNNEVSGVQKWIPPRYLRTRVFEYEMLCGNDHPDIVWSRRYLFDYGGIVSEKNIVDKVLCYDHKYR